MGDLGARLAQAQHAGHFIQRFVRNERGVHVKEGGFELRELEIVAHERRIKPRGIGALDELGHCKRRAVNADQAHRAAAGENVCCGNAALLSREETLGRGQSCGVRCDEDKIKLVF